MLVMVFTAVLFVSGCTHMHTPKMSRFDMVKIPEFSTQKSVSLINGQSDTEQVLFAQNMGHKFYADLNKWTDIAISITDRELTKRGGKVSNSAEKSMTLAVLSTKVTTGGWGFRGYLHLHVKTGNDYEKTFEVEVPSGYLYNAADGALARAVVFMLSDANIISYLCE
ncbi:MAG: hypothetical protein KKE61_09205, partial [Proteobacteria bacterium]|nr:hypothetical protein [Pseudomonadota bacterium]